MITISEAYTTNNQHIEYASVPIIVQQNKLAQQQRTPRQTHDNNINNNKQNQNTAAKNLAGNLRQRIKPKQTCGVSTTNCCCSSSSIPCCGLLSKSRLGRVCERMCNCATNTKTTTMTTVNELRAPEPLVANGHLDRRRVCINVSGKRYETRESTLQKCPETLLALSQRELFFDSLNGEYFFDRNRKAFGAILTYYQTGVLLKPANLDERIFAAELRFFGFEVESQAHIPQNPINESENLLPSNPILRKVWQLFEFPDTSFFARIVSLFSMSVILLSIVMFCIETLPEFKEAQYKTVTYLNGSVHETNEITGYRTKRVYEPVFFTTESACIAWFTFEYVMRLLASPRKFQFIYQPLNMIDLVAIIPFYITLILKQTDQNVSSLSILRVLRLVRVFRIFKLSRYSKGLKILGYTFRASLQELGLLAFFLVIGIILFASAAYYCEEPVSGTKFKSIIHGFWWAIVTMTTVGYGDMTPETLGGQLVGSFCVLVGVLAIAFPVPVIVNNFTYYYTLDQGSPDPLDDEYLEVPLGNNRRSYISTGSLTSVNSESDPSDINRNSTKRRKSPTTGLNGMVNQKELYDDEERIHYEMESPV